MISLNSWEFLTIEENQGDFPFISYILCVNTLGSADKDFICVCDNHTDKFIHVFNLEILSEPADFIELVSVWYYEHQKIPLSVYLSANGFDYAECLIQIPVISIKRYVGFLPFYDMKTIHHRKTRTMKRTNKNK